MKKTLKQRKSRFLNSTLVFTLAALLLHPVVSYAEENDKNKNTTASVSFIAGELKLTSVPSLDFGTQSIVGTEQNYTADTIQQNIQISDLRGSGNGWHLTASLSKFRLDDVDSTTETLQGAYITISNQKISCDNISLEKPECEKEVILTSGSASATILTAQKEKGMGIWNDDWDKESAVLTILPGTAKVGTSHAVIDWSLQDTP